MNEFTFRLINPNFEIETGRSPAVGSARRWRAVFCVPQKTASRKLSLAKPRPGMGNDGLGEPPKPARGPRALPIPISEFGIKLRRALSGITLAILIPVAALAGPVQYQGAATGSTCKIEGTSTIHDWDMESKLVSGTMEADEHFPESAITNVAAAGPAVQVSVAVRSFKSYSKKMDEVMQETMNAPQHPKIEFKLIELKPKSAAEATGPLKFDATGVLTINGTLRTNTFPVTIAKTAGQIKVTGSTKLKMTDFGVKPPAPSILGMSVIKTGDEVIISFQWIAAPKVK